MVALRRNFKAVYYEIKFFDGLWCQLVAKWLILNPINKP
jgi:hypothetical protein